MELNYQSNRTSRKVMLGLSFLMLFLSLCTLLHGYCVLHSGADDEEQCSNRGRAEESLIYRVGILPFAFTIGKVCSAKLPAWMFDGM